MQKYYTTLGLTSNCSEADIKKSYKEKVKVTHPDAGGSTEAFNEVKEAYDWLLKNHKKPNKRKTKLEQTGPKSYNLDYVIQWNLLEIFNGKKDSLHVRFNNEFLIIDFKETPRDISFASDNKIIKKKLASGEYTITTSSVIVDSWSNEWLQVTRNGLDLHMKVLKKKDDLELITPFEGITIDNTKFDIVEVRYYGLKEFREDSYVNGNLYIDNSINKPIEKQEPNTTLLNVANAVIDSNKLPIIVVLFVTALLLHSTGAVN